MKGHAESCASPCCFGIDSRPRKTHGVDRVVQQILTNSFEVLLHQARCMRARYMRCSGTYVTESSFKNCCHGDRLTCEAQLTMKADSDGQSSISLQLT